MEQLTEYPGPGLDDYTNVHALNTAFIEATTDMKGPQRGRLATAPFLLFSLRENDLKWWDEALPDRPQGDLLEIQEFENTELCRIQTAAISFLWQLGRQNPYAARIISGASISWCEKVTELPLITLLDRIGTRSDLMLSRLEHPAAGSTRLLDGGTSSRANIRRSSQLTALQALLTRTGLNSYSQLPAAACSMSVPMRVHDRKM